MAQSWKQLLDTGMQVGELTRSQAQRLVRQLVREGQLAEERAKGYVDELLERSRKRTNDLRALVRREVREQLAALGLATKDDLRRLERKLDRLAGVTSGGKASAKKSGGKKSGGTKSATKKASAKKSPGRSSGSSPRRSS